MTTRDRSFLLLLILAWLALIGLLCVFNIFEDGSFNLLHRPALSGCLWFLGWGCEV